MSRFRLLLLGLLAVLAVSAVAAVSSASGAQTCTGGIHFVFCTSPGNVPIENELVLGLGGLSILAGTLGGAEAKFHCPDVHFHGKVTNLGAGSGILTFLHCTVEKPANCKLSSETVEAKFNTVQESATLATYTGSGANNEFTTLIVENQGGTCGAAGTFPVTGSQMVETPTGGEGKVEQEVVAKKVESNLKLGGNTASFSSKGEAHLGGTNAGSAWLVMAGE